MSQSKCPSSLGMLALWWKLVNTGWSPAFSMPEYELCRWHYHIFTIYYRSCWYFCVLVPILGQPSFQSLPFLLIFSLNNYILFIDITLPLATSDALFIFPYFVYNCVYFRNFCSQLSYRFDQSSFTFYFMSLKFWNLIKAMKILLHSCACFL